MKAVFYWIDGPLAGQMVERSGSRIPLGAHGEDGVPVPGHDVLEGCACVYLKDGHYFVQDRCTPGGLLADGRPVPLGTPVEVRGGTTLRFGPDGPGMRFGFEVETADLLRRDFGRRVTPTQVLRRSALSFGGFDAPPARPQPRRRSRARWAVALAATVALAGTAWLGGPGRGLLEFGEPEAILPSAAAAQVLPLAAPVPPPPAAVPEAKPQPPPDMAVRFQQVFEKGARSLVYLRVKWELEHQGTKHELTATGTGFVIDDKGHVVTAKHVVHPWKFRGIHVKLAHEGVVGWTPTDRLEIQAWRIGDSIGPDDDDAEDADEAHPPRWSTAAGSIKVCAHQDHPTRTNVLDGTGLEHWASLDADPARDVILLQITEDPPAPLDIMEEDQLADGLPALEPVVAVGFPLGTRLFEEQRVVPSPALGYVRKHERLIYHTAPVMPGNSGGPLIDCEGRVVGLVNGMYSDQQNLTVSVSAMRIHDLLRRMTCGGESD